MEAIFTFTPEQEMANRIKEIYPYGCVGLVGDNDAAKRIGDLLGANGNPVYFLHEEDEVPETARYFVGVGGAAEAITARKLSSGKPLLFLSTTAERRVYDVNCGLGYQIHKLEYPKVIFYDKAKINYEFQAEAFCAAFGLFAEVTDRAALGLRTEREMLFRGLASELAERLTAEISTEELVTRSVQTAELLDGGGSGGFYALAESLFPSEYGGKTVHSRFYSHFTGLLLSIWFTKFEFSSILLSADKVRTHALMERLGIKAGGFKRLAVELEPYRRAVEKVLPTEEFLFAVLERFVFEAGKKGVDLRLILNDFLIAAELTEEFGLAGLLARTGFIDGIMDAAK